MSNRNSLKFTRSQIQDSAKVGALSLIKHGKEEPLLVVLQDLKLQNMIDYEEQLTGKTLKICVNNNEKGLTIMETIIIR